MCELNRVKHDSSVQHAEVRSEILRDTIVPVFEFAVGTTGSHLATARLILCYGVVEAEFRAEPAIELILKAVHEGTVARRFRSIVLNATIANHACAAIMELLILLLLPGFAAATATAAVGAARYPVSVTVKVHYFSQYRR